MRCGQMHRRGRGSSEQSGPSPTRGGRALEIFDVQIGAGFVWVTGESIVATENAVRVGRAE